VTAEREIGVIGTVVEDTIDRPGEATVRDMGGTYHSVIAMCVLLPPDVTAVPITAVGEDAIARVRADWALLPGISLEGVHPVPAVNNKVHLEYDRDGNREETLSGGVPPVEWERLEPWSRRVEGWCWNFVAGNEVDRETFERVKRASTGALYLDVHSLCLAPSRQGRPREHRAPEDWEGWVEGSTWVQVNEIEAGLLSEGRAYPLPHDREGALAARVHALGAEGLLITRGSRGATWLPRRGPALEVPARPHRAIDPTGCGDVFGAAWVALHVARGMGPEAAVRGAVRAAGAAATVSGTARLAAVLERAAVAIFGAERARR
jgi:sugar/nucleoside kinase (ribokinase family)